MSVVIKLNSWTNKIDGIKFVKGIINSSASEARLIVEGHLPAIIKEYNSKVEADAIIASNPNNANYDNINFAVKNKIPATLIRSAGIGIVSGNPNDILELQSNHLLSVVQLQDGSKQWAFAPNNNAGEKWVEITDTSKNYLEERQITQLIDDSLNTVVSESVHVTGGNFGISARGSLEAINAGKLGNIRNIKTDNSNKIYIAMQTGIDTYEWVLLAEKTW